MYDQYYQRLYREQSYDDNKPCFKSSIDLIKPSRLKYLFSLIKLNICIDLELMTIVVSSSLSAHHPIKKEKLIESKRKSSFQIIHCFI